MNLVKRSSAKISKRRFHHKSNIPNPNQIYKDYCGRYHKILGVGPHSETSEVLVCYKSLYHDSIYGYGPVWMEPMTKFMENVTTKGIVTTKFRLLHPMEVLSAELVDVLNAEALNTEALNAKALNTEALIAYCYDSLR